MVDQVLHDVVQRQTIGGRNARVLKDILDDVWWPDVPETFHESCLDGLSEDHLERSDLRRNNVIFKGMAL